jgi:hypothetical protein
MPTPKQIHTYVCTDTEEIVSPLVYIHRFVRLDASWQVNNCSRIYLTIAAKAEKYKI